MNRVSEYFVTGEMVPVGWDNVSCLISDIVIFKLAIEGDTKMALENAEEISIIRYVHVFLGVGATPWTRRKN